MIDLDFKIKLLKLYPAYDKVTGPYTRPDGRKHLCLNNSNLSKGNPNKTRTLSYPKALIEVREGRLLTGNETADHIDEDFTNDDINNLQILSRPANILKSFNANPDRKEEYGRYICPQCLIGFLAKARQVRGNNIVKGKAGPFCSRHCAGKHNQQIQANGRLAQLVEATDLSSVK